MKLIITNPDAIYDWENSSFFEGIKKALDDFIQSSEDNYVATVSIHSEKLEIIPKEFSPIDLSKNRVLRKSPDLIKRISKILQIEFEDILVLGTKDDDMILAANAKILLLRAEYAKKCNPEARIYRNEYGIKINSSNQLHYFIQHYLSIEKPWFFSLNVESDFSVYGLTDAMTNKMGNQNVAEICNTLRSHLKNGTEKGKSAFGIYFLLSMYRIFKEVKDIDYWGYYPSSDGEPNDSLLTIKELLRKSFGSRVSKDVLIRHKASEKRHKLTRSQRISEGCSSQFDTIHINKYFKNKIKDKNFCIIDDFSTHGTSSETVRNLLKRAGAKKIIFVCLGKFYLTYKKYDYTLEGDFFKTDYSYQLVGSFQEINGTINHSYSKDLLKIFERYF